MRVKLKRLLLNYKTLGKNYTKKIYEININRLFTFKWVPIYFNYDTLFVPFLNVIKTKRIEVSEYILKNVIGIRYRYPMYYYYVYRYIK